MTILLAKPDLNELKHHGIKGMRWGVHKKEEPAGPPPSMGLQGVTLRRDGSMEIEPGANLQRLVRSNGTSVPMKDITYASLGNYDNSRYVKAIGGKGFFGGGRDRVLSIQAVKPIKAPSVEEATKISSQMLLTNSAFRKKNTDAFSEPISKKELEQIRRNPTGKVAHDWYITTNTKLTFDKEYDPDAPAVQKMFREAMVKKGYNAVRDENDVAAGIAKVPIIIFNPQESLKVVKVTDITEELRAANKDQLKQYKKLGEDWVDSQLYSGN